MAHNSNNVRRRLRVHAFALAAGLAAAPFAHAVCDPSDAALAAMTSVAVDFPLDDAGALLGLDGSRIKSSDLDDPLRVTLDARAPDAVGGAGRLVRLPPAGQARRPDHAVFRPGGGWHAPSVPRRAKRVHRRVRGQARSAADPRGKRPVRVRQAAWRGR
ncbi:hypothetical protein [Burkholderia ubonensis]|uniref:hypothetical protein n=1 Tax=Burkholderia ubonensis TaxID=101571 RepID=UPI000AE24B94|nr:hypothetical protein [Burkholderia ubonensis]